MIICNQKNSFDSLQSVEQNLDEPLILPSKAVEILQELIMVKSKNLDIDKDNPLWNTSVNGKFVVEFTTK